MLSSFVVSIFVGTLLGFLSGLGIGGGSLLILWLTIVMDWAPMDARSTNLLFFLPCALIACTFRVRKGELKLTTLLPAIIAGCITSAVFTCISIMLDGQLLRKLFGVLLIAAGFRELRYQSKKKESQND